LSRLCWSEWAFCCGAPLAGTSSGSGSVAKIKKCDFDSCNPLKYRDTILDKSVKNRFLQQNRFVSALTNPQAVGQTINIGPDAEYITILELAEMIADILNFKRLDPIFVKPRPCEVKYASCSANKSRKIFGYKTRHNLRGTLADMASWIEKRGPK
jgi:hypothetical protein